VAALARRRPRDNRSPAASEGRYRGSDLAVTAGELNAGAGVGRLGDRVRAWGDVMRVLLAVLLVAGYEERWTMSFCQPVVLVIVGIMTPYVFFQLAK